MNIAVILPCYNEEAAIAEVIQSFAKSLPDAAIYVCDNNSTDNTAGVAQKAGAHVIHEPRKGKGNAVRRLFADIDADIYVMADGDGTYDSEAAPDMVAALQKDNLDMVLGLRDEQDHAETSRAGHRFGNDMINRVVNLIFAGGMKDMLSGYRIFSRRFVKTFPAFSSGFEIETELSIHALQMRLPTADIKTRYFERAEGTHSKLSTYKDGIRILNFILFLFKEGKPFTFFSLIAAALMIVSLGLFVPIVFEYFDTGLVQRFPTLFVSIAGMLAAAMSFICGIVLDSVNRGRLEAKKLAYLRYTSPRDQT